MRVITRHHPWSLIPPHRVTRPQQVYELVRSMYSHGWVGDPLLGYRDTNHDVQLISGTHRHAACGLVGILVPVRVYPNNLLTRTLGRLRYWQCRLQGKL